MDKARAAGDQPAYLRLDSAFHEQFFANCGNRYFAEAYARIVPKVAALRTHLATRPDHTRMSYEEHKQILQSIQRKRDKELIPILDKHIERTRSAYTRNIEDIAAADRVAAMIADTALGASSVTGAPRLELAGVCKAFGGVPAVIDMSLAVSPGEIHALVGHRPPMRKPCRRIRTWSVSAAPTAIAARAPRSPCATPAGPAK